MQVFKFPFAVIAVVHWRHCHRYIIVSFQVPVEKCDQNGWINPFPHLDYWSFASVVGWWPTGGWAHSICPVPLLYFSTHAAHHPSLPPNYHPYHLFIWIIITIAWVSCCFLDMWSQPDENQLLHLATSAILSTNYHFQAPTQVTSFKGIWFRWHIYVNGNDTSLIVIYFPILWNMEYCVNISLHIWKQSPGLHGSGDSTAKLTLSLIVTLDKLDGPRVKVNCSS